MTDWKQDLYAKRIRAQATTLAVMIDDYNNEYGADMYPEIIQYLNEKHAEMQIPATRVTDTLDEFISYLNDTNIEYNRVNRINGETIIRIKGRRAFVYHSNGHLKTMIKEGKR